jgi:hypothetical protein
MKIAAMVRARSDESGGVFTEAFVMVRFLSEFAGMRDSVRNKYNLSPPAARFAALSRSRLGRSESGVQISGNLTSNQACAKAFDHPNGRRHRTFGRAKLRQTFKHNGLGPGLSDLAVGHSVDVGLVRRQGTPKQQFARQSSQPTRTWILAMIHRRKRANL